jgi:transcriptional regulator with XRE-family HTH domain
MRHPVVRDHNTRERGAVMPTLGERLRELRLAAGLSQRELASRVSVSFPHISKIEGGTETASDELLVRIAGEVGVDPDELLLAAERVPEILRQQVIDKPQLALQFFRRWQAGEISDEQVAGLAREDDK